MNRHILMTMLCSLLEGCLASSAELDVNLSTLPPGAAAVLVRGGDGTRCLKPVYVTEHLERFRVQLPPDTNGTVYLVFTVYDTALEPLLEGYAVAHAQAGVPDPGVLDVALSAGPVQPCGQARSCWSRAATLSQGISAIWAVTPVDVWVAGTGVLYHFGGQRWDALPLADLLTPAGMFGSGGQDIWIVGSTGSRHHYDGTSWSADRSASPLVDSFQTAMNYSAIWGSGREYYATGSSLDAQQGGIAHFDGSSWHAESVPAPTPGLHGIWGSSLADLWAVGEQATVLHRKNGGSWRHELAAEAMASGGYLTAVWGSSAQDVWIGGLGGLLLHYDGSRFSLQMLGTAAWNALGGNSASGIWAIGDTAHIGHYDGTQWSTEPVAVTPPLGTVNLNGIATDCAGIWVIGSMGTILRYRW